MIQMPLCFTLQQPEWIEHIFSFFQVFDDTKYEVRTSLWKRWIASTYLFKASKELKLSSFYEILASFIAYFYFFHFYLFILFIFLIYFNWRLITLQYCIGFVIHKHGILWETVCIFIGIDLCPYDSEKWLLTIV